MRYLGIAKNQQGHVIMPDNFVANHHEETYEAVEIDDLIVLLRSELNRDRLAEIEHLAEQSIEDHRTTLEGLAR